MYLQQVLIGDRTDIGEHDGMIVRVSLWTLPIRSIPLILKIAIFTSAKRMMRKAKNK
ncbi:hypothetical protein D3C87_1422830 [compost metagenome]